MTGLGDLLAGYDIKVGSRPGFKELVAETPVNFGQMRLLGTLSIGAYSFSTGTGALRDVAMGRFCSVAPNVLVGLNEHPTGFLSTHPISFGRGSCFARDEYFKGLQQVHHFNEPVRTEIGHDVWLGAGAIVSRGVKVGTGAVIGAGAVVTKDVEPYAIMAGVPARLIRYRFAPEIVQRLLDCAWWRLDLTAFPPLDFQDIEGCLNRIEAVDTTARSTLHVKTVKILQAGGEITVQELKS